MVVLAGHAVVPRERMTTELVDAVHRPGGDVVAAQRLQPYVARPRLEAGLEDRQQHGAVVEPQHPRGEARVVRELVESERLAELDPERLIATREEQPLAVARLIVPI